MIQIIVLVDRQLIRHIERGREPHYLAAVNFALRKVKVKLII